MAQYGKENCAQYAANVAYGPIKDRLVNNSLVSVANIISCNQATLMFGSLDMDTPLTMTDDVKSSQLTWIITDMAIEAADEVHAMPLSFGKEAHLFRISLY